MNLFSLTHLNAIAKDLPDPNEAAQAASGYNTVIRLPIRADELLERDLEDNRNAYVEFELMMIKDAKGTARPRWVLRGLVAM
jgi:hypothetical protein